MTWCAWIQRLVESGTWAGLSAGEIRVAVALAVHQKRRIDPSNATVAKASGLSLRATIYAIRGLEDRGLIRRDQRRRDTALTVLLNPVKECNFQHSLKNKECSFHHPTNTEGARGRKKGSG